MKPAFSNNNLPPQIQHLTSQPVTLHATLSPGSRHVHPPKARGCPGPPRSLTAAYPTSSRSETATLRPTQRRRSQISGRPEPQTAIFRNEPGSPNENAVFSRETNLKRVPKQRLSNPADGPVRLRPLRQSLPGVPPLAEAAPREELSRFEQIAAADPTDRKASFEMPTGYREIGSVLASRR